MPTSEPIPAFTGRRITRPAFDPDQDFVTVREMTLEGTKLAPDQPFDKSLVTSRRLRQLYDGRYIKQVPATTDKFSQLARKYQEAPADQAKEKRTLSRVHLGDDEG